MIPLVDLKAQYKSIKEEIDAAINKVIEEGDFILVQRSGRWKRNWPLLWV